MLPTPSTSHVNHDQIYEPAEDSYLLLDTLSSPTESTFLQTRFPAESPVPLVLEVGIGSGVVLAFLNANASHIFGRKDIAAIGTDVNEFACKATAQTVKLASKESAGTPGEFLNPILGDLTSPLRHGSTDVLIFNPPYVPTEELPPNPNAQSNGFEINPSAAFERDSHLLSLSYAGGVDGMETTNRLLAQIPEVLSLRGVAYVLLCAQNKPDEVTERVREWEGGWFAEVVGRSGNKAGWERLVVLRILREGR